MPEELKISNEQFMVLLQERIKSRKLNKRLRVEMRKLITLTTRKNLHEISPFMREKTKEEMGIYLESVNAYLQDPLVAEVIPKLGIKPLKVKWELGLDDGPTSSRFAVVDYNADTGELVKPARWNDRSRRFEGLQGQELDETARDLFQFHQVNVWAVVSTVLAMFEDRNFALGRPIPWGTNGNRLIIVPHVGFGENAFYDRHSKSLQFYYYGTDEDPKYTCLSHDIVAHETGHALLDGIRPFYYHFTSTETAAFHEFIADMTAILSAMRNNDIRQATAWDTEADLKRAKIISGLAEEFGENTAGLDALRSADNDFTMEDANASQSPHFRSQVLSGAMFDILIKIAAKYMEDQKEKYIKEGKDKDPSPANALWWATQRIIRFALRPLDLCPPVDIRFIDYARAVIRHFDLYEPANSIRREFYNQVIREEFHDRKLCSRSYETCLKDPEGCELFMEAPPNRWDISHGIGSISRSRTGAYYFLNDNRRTLRIPSFQDIEVVDLYDTNKLGRAAKRLPAEIVLEYVWREEITLEGEEYGPLQNQTAELLCGGTLVFDENRNLLSWFRKPGTQVEEDSAEGEVRLKEFREHILTQVDRGVVGLSGSSEVDIHGGWSPPVVASTEDGVLRFELTPHLRNELNEEPEEDEKKRERKEKDAEERRIWNWSDDEWTTSY